SQNPALPCNAFLSFDTNQPGASFLSQKAISGSTRACPSLHEEILHQAIERRSMFDLCPVATAPKDVELDILQRMQQFLAGRKRDHAVVPPVYDEGRRM